MLKNIEGWIKLITGTKVIALYFFLMLAFCLPVYCASPAIVNLPPLLHQPHYISEAEAFFLIRESYEKANFFSVLEHPATTTQKKEIPWIEGHYAKIDLRDPSRYLGNMNKSRLYTLNVYLMVDEKAEKRNEWPLPVNFKITTENEGIAGKKYANVVLQKFLDEFVDRLSQFDAFRQVHPADIAASFLKGDNLVTNYGYSTLKIVNLTYEEPDTWDGYEKALQFLSKNCVADDEKCQNIIETVFNTENFWTVLKTKLETHPEKMNVVALTMPEKQLENPKFLSLLSQVSSQSSGSLGEFESQHDNAMNLPEEWRKEGVGTETARALEKDIAFKMYDFLKRSNTFDVDTQESLMLEKIAENLFPLALRKGLEYEIHIYDDTRSNFGGIKFNAFTSGGGILYFSRSLVQTLDPQDEDAIASVVAHEMGHNEAYHLQRQILRTETANVIYQLSKIGDVFVPGVSDLTYLSSQLVLKHYGRRDEYEADRMGLYLLYKAGYDPKGMERTMEMFYKKTGNRYTGLMESHPAPPARLKRIKQLVEDRNMLELTDYGNLDEDF